ncbi:RNA polymerase sigma factor [Cryobacterium algoricola]|uniref:RNA polymerase sigma factor n=1 Tax=Cryobacterium algoricola TaxID=1259183 RepID=A0ABY2IEH3_9MICO|nr:RNA polymerase sigma factor [Cryobacterium algoricola]TFB86322.1 RNA polymerase sigma factor [Cryobacterium algoricola]
MPDSQIRALLEHADDRTLVERTVDGDIRAFEVLVRRHGPLMRAYATRILGSNDEADDVVQETFITAWAKLPTLENPALAKGWLMRIVSHKSIDRIRARRHHSSLEDLDAPAPDHHSPITAVEALSRSEALSQVLSELPTDQRRCWELKEFGDYSYAEIAEELDLPVSTIRGLLARARKTLIREMEAWR